MSSYYDLDGDAPLTAFAIPHLEVVLDEIFYIPPSSLFKESTRPRTLGELARRAKMPLVEVISRLGMIADMSQGLEISCDELLALMNSGAEAAPLLLIDVRADWEFVICQVPGSILLSAANFAELLPQMRQAKTVVTICHHGIRSFSAALYLKEQGVATVRSLSGGVAAWARLIDPRMPTY